MMTAEDKDLLATYRAYTDDEMAGMSDEDLAELEGLEAKEKLESQAGRVSELESQDEGGQTTATLFPSLTKAYLSDEPWYSKAGSALGDVMSMPGRTLVGAGEALGTSLGGGTAQETAQNFMTGMGTGLGEKEPDGEDSGVVKSTLRDPVTGALFALPVGGIIGKTSRGTGFVGSKLAPSLAVGAAGGAGTIGTRVLTADEYSKDQALVDMAVNVALSGVLTTAGLAARAGALKYIASKYGVPPEEATVILDKVILNIKGKLFSTAGGRAKALALPQEGGAAADISRAADEGWQSRLNDPSAPLWDTRPLPESGRPGDALKTNLEVMGYPEGAPGAKYKMSEPFDRPLGTYDEPVFEMQPKFEERPVNFAMGPRENRPSGVSKKEYYAQKEKEARAEMLKSKGTQSPEDEALDAEYANSYPLVSAVDELSTQLIKRGLPQGATDIITRQSLKKTVEEIEAILDDPALLDDIVRLGKEKWQVHPDNMDKDVPLFAEAPESNGFEENLAIMAEGLRKRGVPEGSISRLVMYSENATPETISKVEALAKDARLLDEVAVLAKNKWSELSEAYADMANEYPKMTPRELTEATGYTPEKVDYTPVVDDVEEPLFAEPITTSATPMKPKKPKRTPKAKKESPLQPRAEEEHTPVKTSPEDLGFGEEEQMFPMSRETTPPERMLPVPVGQRTPQGEQQWYRPRQYAKVQTGEEPVQVGTRKVVSYGKEEPVREGRYIDVPQRENVVPWQLAIDRRLKDSQEAFTRGGMDLKQYRAIERYLIETARDFRLAEELSGATGNIDRVIARLQDIQGKDPKLAEELLYRIQGSKNLGKALMEARAGAAYKAPRGVDLESPTTAYSAVKGLAENQLPSVVEKALNPRMRSVLKAGAAREAEEQLYPTAKRLMR